jgi:hypothetical protein
MKVPENAAEPLKVPVREEELVTAYVQVWA